MSHDLTEMMQSLTQIALSQIIPFCYGCYIEAPTGKCPTCHSDNLMKLLPSVGCEYGTEWAIKHLIEQELTPANTDEAFENSVSDCYPETVTIGWMTFDAVTAMKQLDPISWRIAKSEWIDEETTEERLVTFDNGTTHYWASDIENYIEENSEQK